MYLNAIRCLVFCETSLWFFATLDLPNLTRKAPTNMNPTTKTWTAQPASHCQLLYHVISFPCHDALVISKTWICCSHQRLQACPVQVSSSGAQRNLKELCNLRLEAGLWKRANGARLTAFPYPWSMADLAAWVHQLIETFTFISTAEFFGSCTHV